MIWSLCSIFVACSRPDPCLLLLSLIDEMVGEDNRSGEKNVNVTMRLLKANKGLLPFHCWTERRASMFEPSFLFDLRIKVSVLIWHWSEQQAHPWIIFIWERVSLCSYVTDSTLKLSSKIQHCAWEKIMMENHVVVVPLKAKKDERRPRRPPRGLSLTILLSVLLSYHGHTGKSTTTQKKAFS